MSLQVLLTKIDAAGREQLQQIQMETRSKIDDMLELARQEARRIEEKASNAARIQTSRERTLILDKARLEGMRIVGDARKDRADSVLTGVRQQLAAMRSSPVYRQVLGSLVHEALDGLGMGDNCTVWLLADSRDKNILEDILAEKGSKVKLSYELNCWGGLVARSEDGRIEAINTLESRLERAKTFLRGYLAVLLEKDNPEAPASQVNITR
jgi:vacuolar-type H+-ATPase subunit E/Vma4